MVNIARLASSMNHITQNSSNLNNYAAQLVDAEISLVPPSCAKILTVPPLIKPAPADASAAAEAALPELSSRVSEQIESWQRVMKASPDDTVNFKRAAVELMRVAEEQEGPAPRQAVIAALSDMGIGAGIAVDAVQAIMARAKDAPRDSRPASNRSNGSAKSRSNEAEGKRLIVRCASDVEPKPVEWLWPGRLAKGKTTLLGGDPGVGKSQLSMFIAANISNGGLWPCQEGMAPTGSVVVLCAEDGTADTIVPRLMAAGADREKVTVITAVTDDHGDSRRIFNLSNDLDLLERHIEERGDVALVIIDPVDAYIGAGVDSHKNAAVRAVLEPISELADRLGVAILAVTHFSKQQGGKAMYRFIGSIAHVGSARIAFAVIADAENEGRALVLHAKNNLAPPQKGLGYRLEQRVVTENGVLGSSVHFEPDHVLATADEALAAERDRGDRSDTDDAEEFLKVLLAGGPVTVEVVEQQAVAAGLLGSDQSIGQSKPFRSARKRLGIRPYQPKGEKAPGWVWALPTKNCPSGVLGASGAP
jgi:AAA domain